MDEANRIISGACKNPLWNGSVTVDVVDKILESCGGQIICNGRLRKFKFTKITNKSFTFKTVDWFKGEN